MHKEIEKIMHGKLKIAHELKKILGRNFVNLTQFFFLNCVLKV